MKADGREDKDKARNFAGIPAGLALVALAVCVTSWFQVSGHRYGMLYGVFSEPPSPILFAPAGPNYFQSTNLSYFTIAICFLIYLAGLLLGRSLLAMIFRILALCVATYPYFNMLMNRFPGRVFNDSLLTSIYLDYICLGLIPVIVGIEFVSRISRKTDDLPPATIA